MKPTTRLPVPAVLARQQWLRSRFGTARFLRRTGTFAVAFLLYPAEVISSRMHHRALLAPLAALATGLLIGFFVFKAPPIASGNSLPPAPENESADPAACSTFEVERVGGNQRMTTVAVDRQAMPVRQANPSPAALATRVSRRDLAQRALERTVMVQVPGEYGSGVILDDKGHVLTAAHVVKGRKNTSVTSSDGTRRDARVVQRDDELDLALLKVEGLPSIAPLRWSSVTTVAMGDEVYAMGAPRKMSFTLTRGIVSHTGRSFDGVRYIQTDVSINAGNSGGPLLDEAGRLIGVLSFVLRDSEGLAFAIPIEYALSRFPEVFGEFPTRLSFSEWTRATNGERAEEPPRQESALAGSAR